MRYMTNPSSPDLEDAPELAVMILLDHALTIVEDALYATGRKLLCSYEDDFHQDAHSATNLIAQAIIHHTETLRTTLAAYQNSVKNETKYKQINNIK